MEVVLLDLLDLVLRGVDIIGKRLLLIMEIIVLLLRLLLIYEED